MQQSRQYLHIPFRAATKVMRSELIYAVVLFNIKIGEADVKIPSQRSRRHSKFLCQRPDMQFFTLKQTAQDDGKAGCQSVMFVFLCYQRHTSFPNLAGK